MKSYKLFHKNLQQRTSLYNKELSTESTESEEHTVKKLSKQKKFQANKSDARQQEGGVEIIDENEEVVNIDFSLLNTNQNKPTITAENNVSTKIKELLKYKNNSKMGGAKVIGTTKLFADATRNQNRKIKKVSNNNSSIVETNKSKLDMILQKKIRKQIENQYYEVQRQYPNQMYIFRDSQISKLHKENKNKRVTKVNQQHGNNNNKAGSGLER